MYREVEEVLKDGNINVLLKESLKRFILSFTWNRGKFDAQKTLEGNIEAWTNQINMHPESKEKTMSHLKAHRESTYINCWNSNEAMSLAMWQLFGGGEEAVAIRTTIEKLEIVLSENKNELQELGYESDVSHVYYLPNLKNPDEETSDRIMDILTNAKGSNVAQFSIKPEEYSYENEVRGIIYPKRSVNDKLSDPEPGRNGFNVPIKMGSGETSNQINRYIDEVHIHPLQDESSLIYKVIQELHQLYGLEDIPIRSNVIKALGEEADFKGISRCGDILLYL